MIVDKVMVPAERVVTCLKTDRAADVAAKMQEKQIGCVVVVEPRDQADGTVVLAPVGIVSTRDYVALVAARKDYDVQVATMMTHGIGSIAAGRACSDAAELMSKLKIHHIVVVGEDGRLLGLLSTLDVARETAADANAWPWNRAMGSAYL